MRVILFLCLLLITACEKPPPYQVVDGFRVVVIDDCEYIESHGVGGGEYALTHKGNCKNHKCDVRLERENK